MVLKPIPEVSPITSNRSSGIRPEATPRPRKAPGASSLKDSPLEGRSRLFEKRRLSLVEKNKVSTAGAASSSVTEEHTNTAIADHQPELRSAEEIPVAETQETLPKKPIDVPNEATSPVTENNTESDISNSMIEQIKSEPIADSQYPVLDVVSIEKVDQTSASLSKTNISAKDSCVPQINPKKCSVEVSLEKNITVTTATRKSPVHRRSPVLPDVKREHISANDRKSPLLDLGQPQRSSTPIVQKPTPTRCSDSGDLIGRRDTRCSDSGDRIGRRDTHAVTPGQELRESDTGVLPVPGCGDCHKELSPPRYPDFGYPYYNQYLRMVSSAPRVPLQLGSMDPCFHLRHRELSTYQGYVPPIPHSYGYGTPSVPTYTKDMCSSFCTPAAFLPTMPYYPPFCMLPPTIGLQCPPPYQLPHDVLSQYVRSEATYEHDFIPPPSAFMSDLKRSASKMDDCVDLSSKRLKLNTVV